MSRCWIAGWIVLAAVAVQADEGMWQPHQLPLIEEDLRELGLQIDPNRLTDLTGFPMNAVISLGGCTASFVSPDGLAVTNHHCAYGAIQYNSTEENNLLENGFLAGKREEELFAGPGSRILVTVAVDDVTDEILGDLSDSLGGGERYGAIEQREKAIVSECENDVGHRCRVAAFHGGLEYYRIKQLEIRDVRIVYAPPKGIGRYGGDVDNWMWPRHTGDFTFYRAYVGRDGKPADPSADNVPFRPKHHLTVSTAGLKPGDFVMLAGYPGRTNRYRTASEVSDYINEYYPTRRQLLLEWLRTIEESTADSPADAIKYASTIGGLNNSIKNYQGLLDGFSKSGVVARKQELERGLQRWIVGDAQRRKRYASTVGQLRGLVAEAKAVREPDMYYGFIGRSTMLSTARRLYRLSRESGKPDAEREPGYQERDLKRFEERLTRIDRRYAPAVDRATLRRFILNYAALAADRRVEAFDEWFDIGEDGVEEAALDAKLDAMYAKTKLADKQVRLDWMGMKSGKFEKSKDPFLRLAVHLWDSDRAREAEAEDRSGRFKLTRPQYMAALIEYLMSEGKEVYPDANGTLRVTYGTVRGYKPRDAVYYTPFTGLQGLVEKETGEEPFNSPSALLQAIADESYGRYLDDELKTVPVNFLSSVDTTGGNSGSPTLNAKAELVGLLFDGNYESIIADWDFIPEITRSIHVDIRYALWIMQHVTGAHELLREMGIEP
ncbi:MAG: S46 family peptidase [bacterium]|nr:S46 family peptidase [bacterium]